MNTIENYIVANYLGGNKSAYVKLMNLPDVGERLIALKWLDDHQEIKSFIENWLSDLVPYENLAYPDTIFYMKPTGEYVLEDNSKIYYLCVRYSDFWRILEIKYRMKYADVQSVIKYMVEEAFKRKVKTPKIYNKSFSSEVEEAFKRKVKTPSGHCTKASEVVEEAFKRKVKTPPETAYYLNVLMIEEVFKGKVKTPELCIDPSMRLGEEAFKKHNKY